MKFIREKEKQMSQSVKELDFETAAVLRDELIALKKELDRLEKGGPRQRKKDRKKK